MSNIVEKVKKQAMSLDFLHILLGEYFLKQKVVVIKSPEWTFVAIIARNAKFQGYQGEKWQKTDNFAQSVC